MPLPIESFPNLIACDYANIRQQIKSGDILLASGSSVFSQLIQHVTGSIWSHVAFILRLDAIDRIMVLESVESIGVRTVPLSSYIHDYNGTGNGYPGKLLIARHDQFNLAIINNLSQIAVDLFGYPYSTEDIVRITTRIGMNALGLTKNHPLIQSHKAFICSEYVYECYKSVGINIEYNQEGFIAPVDSARSSHIAAICAVLTQS